MGEKDGRKGVRKTLPVSASRIYPTPEPPREYLNDRRIYIYYPCNEEGNLPLRHPPLGGIGSGMKGNRQ